MLKNLINRLNKNVFPLKAKKYNNLYLPLSRSNEKLYDDQDYVNSAVDQVKSLEKYCKITTATNILDFGCGQGRFANGLLASKQNIKSYFGIDTDSKSVEWCNKWLNQNNKNYTFLHLAAHNERYNPSVDKRLVLPINSNTFDIAFLNSVFSHMLATDIEFYLDELYRVLCNNGLLYLTAFVEENVPDVEENPKDYLGKKAQGPLHRVRYEKSFFLGLLDKSGFTLEDFKHQGIKRTKQSVVVARKLL